MKRVVSTCGVCFGGCGIHIEVDDNGQPTKIRGDKNCPTNEGRLCSKGLAALELAHHPDRLTRPLLRKGKKREGSWSEISWDEALELISGRLLEIRDRQGPESVAFAHGSAKGFQDNYLKRLASAFGTPNVATQGHVCFVPGTAAYQLTFGFIPVPDIKKLSRCLIVWGENVAETRTIHYHRILNALERGAKLIVIDPRKTPLALKADLWLPVRPGSDLALSLGLLHVIIKEGLFETDFVDNWTIGFPELQNHIKDYPPEKVSQITWIDSDMITAAARLYAENGPASIYAGNAIETNLNSVQTLRAIAILMSVTGNLSVEGGNVPYSKPPILTRHSPELTLHHLIPQNVWNRRVGGEPALLPGFRYVTPQHITRAILQEDPYSIRALFIQACNPLLTWPNARETYRALRKVDFLVVSDMFMTPTAHLADIVLPAASFLEFDNVVAATHATEVRIQQKVMQKGDCWSDYRFIHHLAHRMNLGEYFGPDETDFLNLVLKPSGLTFEQFRERFSIQREKMLSHYKNSGFDTASGKVELYSTQLAQWGFDPLPVFRELPETPFSSPGLAKQFPLILFSWKKAPFLHSGGRQVGSLRSSQREPVVCINPDTASKLHILDGNKVYIETPRGRIIQKAKVTPEVIPNTVGADYGWWFPEKGAAEEYGWAEANINILTDTTHFGREIGSTNLRGIGCLVYPA
jgi:anaerobic selenocysteine-containing dehydrogenase